MKVEGILPSQQLVEVWGDTVDVKHLAYSIVLGVGISLPAYLLASRFLTGFVSSQELARSYGMLAGLAGCLSAGVLCAVLFKPKRIVVEDSAGDPIWRQEILMKLAEQTGGLGTVADLPPEVVLEMKDLEIFDLFESYENTERMANSLSNEVRRSDLSHQSSAIAPIKEA